MCRLIWRREKQRNFHFLPFLAVDDSMKEKYLLFSASCCLSVWSLFLPRRSDCFQSWRGDSWEKSSNRKILGFLSACDNLLCKV
jgi:hypothetical protein